MKSREEILQILKQSQDTLRQEWPIGRLALFGSVARGEQTPDSDVDLLVEFVGKVGWGVVRLEDQLAELLGVRVDVVSRNSLKPWHWERIGPDVVEIPPNA
jgi:predicted nucleotidyltransferase